MRHTIFWLLVFGIATFLFACVDVEDVIDPRFRFVVNSEEGEIRDTYYYGDSINFEVTFTDNSSIVKSEVAITKVGSDLTDTISTWGVYITEEVNDEVDLSGSRFVQRQIDVKIPTIFNGSFLDTLGEYQVFLSVEDVGGTKITFNENFVIRADQSAPSIIVEDLGLDRDAGGNYEACPGFAVPLSGYTLDNTELKSLQYRFTRANNPAEFGVSSLFTFDSEEDIEDDSVSLQDVFQRNGQVVSVPRQISGKDVNNETLLFSVTAIDLFGNRTTSIGIPIVINCDTSIPVIQILETTPALNQELEFDVPQGAFFALDLIRFADDTGLNSLNITLKKNGNTFNTIDRTVNLGGSIQDTTFDSNNSNFFFQLDLAGNVIFNRVGDSFTLKIKAIDSENNIAEKLIEINVVPDASPIAELVDLLINPDNQQLDTTFLNVSNRGNYNATETIANAESNGIESYLIARGKIQDDLGISSIVATWELPNEGGIITAEENYAGFEPSVVSLTDFIPALPSPDAFIFDSGRLGGYILTITITDTGNNITTLSYTIQVD